MVVGPPGTGKTDTAVQILNALYHNCPSQRTLIITHSNQALNDLFEKIMQVLSLHSLLSELLMLSLD
jgi:intron-binding protein aquarius